MRELTTGRTSSINSEHQALLNYCNCESDGAALERQTGTVNLSIKVLQEPGVERHAGCRDLISLEKAKRVAVEPREDRSPRVMILDVKAGHES